MSIQKIFNFDNPAEFDVPSEIEIANSKAKLKLLDLPDQEFIENFNGDVGFIYDSDKVEFVGGKVQQKDQRPVNATFGATYKSIINGNWGYGILTGTAFGGATIADEKLDLAYNDLRYVEYSAVNNADSLQEGCVKFKVTPNFTGGPDAEEKYFSIMETTNNPNNVIYLRHRVSGDMRLQMHDSTGSLIVEIVCFPNFVSGITYEVGINWNINDTGGGLGATRVFVDGVQQGATHTGTGTRTAATIFRVGTGVYKNSNSNFKIKDFIVFSSVQHTANYTPGYTVPENIYADSNVTLPEMPYIGAGTLQVLQSVVTIEIGMPKYIIQVGRSGIYLYWNGSAWVESDRTYAQANDIIIFNTNVPTINIEGKVYGQFEIIFPDNDSQSSVDNLIATVTGQTYSIANPFLKTAVALSVQGILSLIFTDNIDVTDYMKYTIMVDSVEKFWNGSSWAVSSGYAESNTGLEIKNNVTSLNLALGYEIYLICYLHSASGMSSPDISQIDIDYDFWGGEPINPPMCIIWGHIHDIIDNSTDSILVFVSLKNNADYQNKILVTTVQKKITPDAAGYWEISLFRSIDLDPETDYIFEFFGNEFNLIETKTVPAEPSKNYLDL